MLVSSQSTHAPVGGRFAPTGSRPERGAGEGGFQRNTLCLRYSRFDFAFLSGRVAPLSTRCLGQRQALLKRRQVEALPDAVFDPPEMFGVLDDVQAVGVNC